MTDVPVNPSNKISVSVSKVWDDGNNKDGIRPETVTVKLLADGQDTGKTLELKEANKWTAAFNDLDENRNGQKIVYSVEEVEVNGYNVTITGDVQNGFTITNRQVTDVPINPSNKISVSVSKVWDDENNKDGIRPETVTVKLLADGQDTGKTLELKEANKWTAAFNNLDENRNGQKIVYSVEEVEVDGYIAEITGDADTGFTIKNHYKSAPTEKPIPGDPDKPNNSNIPENTEMVNNANGTNSTSHLSGESNIVKTGDETNIWPYIFTLGGSAIVISVIIGAVKKRRRKQ